MAYLEDLNNLATTLLQEYANKNLVPEWFSINVKTLLSKNITLEDWNNVQWYLKNVAAENEAVFKFCQNLNNALTNFEVNVDSAISQAATNALNTATSYTDTKIAGQDAKLTQYTEEQDYKRNVLEDKLTLRIDEIDFTHTNTVAGLIKDFNTRIQEVEDMIDSAINGALEGDY